ncbi:MAG: hypothetical protein HYZ20_14050 [Burkholderiales bacterium]|nr:hypothetical protein [Burkholderiales bacterium]
MPLLAGDFRAGFRVAVMPAPLAVLLLLLLLVAGVREPPAGVGKAAPSPIRREALRRLGLAGFIEDKRPVAVTRHLRSVGFFILTARPGRAGSQALRGAADRLQAVKALPEDEKRRAAQSIAASFQAMCSRRARSATAIVAR